MSRRALRIIAVLYYLSIASCDRSTRDTDGDGGVTPDLAMPAAPSGNWASAPAAPQRLTEVAAVVVRGQIYLLGGLGDGGVTRRVEIFDPKTSRWTSGPALPAAAPAHHLAVAVAEEQIYVLGGYLDILFTATAATLRLDPVSGNWVRRADQPIARGAATAQFLGNRIYVAGGEKQGHAVADLYAYDPVLDSFELRAPNPNAREHLASCAFANQLLVVAGRTPQQGNVSHVELYEPVMNKWTTMPDLPTARGGLAATTLAGRCYVFGGEYLGKSPPNTFPENEGFDFATRTWQTYAPLPTPRHGLATVTLGDQIYVLLGGPQAALNFSDTFEIFSP